MKKIKRLLVFLLLLSMVLALVACAAGKTKSEKDSSAVTADTTESNMSEAYRKAIEDRRAE